MASQPSFQFNLSVGHWKEAQVQSCIATRVRTMGYLSREGEDYVVLQLEYRTFWPDLFTYDSRILIGRLVGEADEVATFESRMQPDLWCSHCWCKDAISFRGGIQIPGYMRGRYFGAIRALTPCNGCEKRFALFDANTDTSCANVFRVFHDKGLYDAVCEALTPYGGLDASYELQLKQCKTRLRKAQNREIVRVAMCPERLGSILERFGYEGLEATF